MRNQCGTSHPDSLISAPPTHPPPSQSLSHPKRFPPRKQCLPSRNPFAPSRRNSLVLKMNRSQDMALRNLLENLPPFRPEPFRVQALAIPRASASAQPVRGETEYRLKAAGLAPAGAQAARGVVKEGEMAGCSTSGPRAGLRSSA